MSRWPTVELGEVLHTQIDAVESAELETVNLAGVYGFARGLFKREPISPLDTTYKRFHRLNAGDFVISSPKAWEGAIARIPEEFDGWFLSPVFPTFRANPDLLDTRYLDWYCKRKAVWTQLQGKAKGMGARRESVSPAQFLSLNIPLPTIDEQQRIVARLDQLADKLRQVKEHLDVAENDAFRLLISMATRRDLSDEQLKSMGWKETAIGDLAKLALSPVTVDANENYPNIGIYSFAKGLFEKPPIEGSRTSAKSLYQIKKGQFIYSRLFAFEGGYALVPPEFDGYYVSNEFPTFDIDLEQATTKFLITLFLTEQDWQELAMSSKGVGDRRLRIQPEKILHRKIWLPPLKEQERIEKMFDTYQALKDKHVAIREASQTLIPSTLERIFQ